MRRAWRKEQAANYLTTTNFSDRSQTAATQVEAKNEHDLEKELERAVSVDERSSSRETNLDIYAVCRSPADPRLAVMVCSVRVRGASYAVLSDVLFCVLSMLLDVCVYAILRFRRSFQTTK